MTLGLELLSAGVVAVAVDEDGRVAARTETGARQDLAAAAFAAIEGIENAPTMKLAVCSVNPESSASIAATKALAGRYGGQLVERSTLASGIACAVAESWIGAAPGASNVVFFGVAEQTSAGILRGGVPMTGAHGRAPAIGWLALNPVEREDYRKMGCLEAEVGAGGIVRRLVWRIKSGDSSEVESSVAGDLNAITVDHVLTAARSGDGVAISIVRDTARYLGMAAANLVAVADPDVLVLGGIMASAPDLLFDAVRTELTRRLPGTMMQALKVVAAGLGADGPAIGAARLATINRH